MYYPVCGMMHIKEPLLLIGKSSPCGSSGFPLSLSEWPFTICPTLNKTLLPSFLKEVGRCVKSWPRGRSEIAQWVHPMKDRSDDPSHHE